MKQEIRRYLLESAELKRRVADELADVIAGVASALIECLRSGGTVALCGNGGSAADAQHLSGELIGRFRLERKAYRAVALTTDTTVITAVGNDYGFEEVFARQVEGLLGEGDVLIVLSTSGNATNCVRAAERARELGAKVIGMTGESGGQLGALADLCIKVPNDTTARIQEAHITIGHILCGLVETALAKESESE